MIDYSRWRESVEIAGSAVAGMSDTLSPFGFEITRDRTYAERALKRFYVYLRGLANATTLQEQFLRELEISLERIYPGLWPRLRLIVVGSDVRLIDSPGSCSLYVRVIGGSMPLLHAYANYIAAAPVLVSEQRLHESSDFYKRVSARRYLYQLAVMSMSMSSAVAEDYGVSLDILRSLLSACAGRDLRTGESPMCPPSAFEDQFYLECLLPWFSRLARDMQSPNDPAHLLIRDFGSGAAVEVTISRSALRTTARRVESAYLEYPRLCSAVQRGPFVGSIDTG